MAIISRSEQSYDNLPLNPKYDVRFRIPYLFERSEFLIATSKTKKSVRVCGCSANLGFSVENTNLGFSVWYQRAPGTTEKKKERMVPASASLPTAGSALPPVGRATPLLW